MSRPAADVILVYKLAVLRGVISAVGVAELNVEYTLYSVRVNALFLLKYCLYRKP